MNTYIVKVKDDSTINVQYTETAEDSFDAMLKAIEKMQEQQNVRIAVRLSKQKKQEAKNEKVV